MWQIVLCIVAADFLTGLGHWFEDTYGLPTWPIIGKEVIEPNIEHHEHPGWIGTMSTLISRNYQTVVPAAFVAVAAVWYLGDWGFYLALVAVLASLGNEVHAWCHRGNNSRVILFLQNIGLAQSPRQHAKHHRPPYDKYYCTLTNFTNEVLEAIHFWRGLEFVIAKCGVHPKRMSPERRGV